MKKIFALLIAILMLTTLVACADKDDTGNPLETLEISDNSFSNNTVGSFTYEVGADGHYEITKYTVNKATDHEVVIPKEIAGIAVTSIADEAFRDLNSITKVTIPDTVERIGNFVFADCDKLTTVVMADSIEELGTGLFYGCDAINNVSLPKLVTKIPDQCFWGCPSLSTISLVGCDDLTVIGEAAFFNCDALVSFTIPATVTEIQDVAFYDCDKLVSITVPASVTAVGDAAFGEISTRITFKTTKGSFFEGYFNEIYAVNEKYYSHYELVLN